MKKLHRYKINETHLYIKPEQYFIFILKLLLCTFFVNIILQFSSKVPGAPPKNVKTLGFFYMFFHSFYIFLSITADTIKL